MNHSNPWPAWPNSSARASRNEESVSPSREKKASRSVSCWDAVWTPARTTGPLPPAKPSRPNAAMTKAARGASGQSHHGRRHHGSAARAASAASTLAQAGVGSESAMSKQGEGEGEGEGQGQGKGKGKGKGQGKGQGQGQGQAQANAQGQGSGQPSPQGTGNKGNWDGTGGADGPRQGATGSSSFTKLPSRDRAALQQSQAEKYPQEYGPLVEQYLRNLSDQSGEK